MPRPKIDLEREIQRILQHVELLPPEADTPCQNYERSVTDLWNLRNYVERKVTGSPYYVNVVQKHMAALDRMLIVNLVEAFERFLKEIASVCVDYLAKCVLDDRFDKLGQVKGSLLAAHFGAESLGKALCESGTWLDCDTVNDRFRRLLSDPFDASGGTFFVFPKKGQNPEDERFRYAIMSLLWQIRHTIVHNLGQITQSDAVKFGLLSRQSVDASRLLIPTRDDVRYVKRFLDETAKSVNLRVAKRLAELLTTFHADNPSLFDPQKIANEFSKDFGLHGIGVAGKEAECPLSWLEAPG
jgi:hypothetical protein